MRSLAFIDPPPGTVDPIRATVGGTDVQRYFNAWSQQGQGATFVRVAPQIALPVLATMNPYATVGANIYLEGSTTELPVTNNPFGF